jgi:HD-GYP domain-containing protein (c-di-GMP phosphodiesterase class II)
VPGGPVGRALPPAKPPPGGTEFLHVAPKNAGPSTEAAAGSRIELAVSDLQLGMFIGALDRPWLDAPFEMQGFLVRSAKDIQLLQSLCRHVYVDKEKSSPGVIARYQARQAAQAAASEVHEQQNGIRKRFAGLTRLFGRRHDRDTALKVERSLQISERLFDETRTLARRIIDDVRIGAAIDTRQAKEAITECVDHILKNPDALLMFSNIKHKDAYTSEHSVNVAILSILLGRRLGLPRYQLEEVGLAGLLHDVGKVLTPDAILNKPTRLTDEEFLIMKMHPSQGRDILSDADGLTRPILMVAHAHHERLNGSGYPRGLKELDLPLYSRVVAVTDTFDAITSDRVYGKGRSNLEAYQILRAASGSHYDEKLVSQFLDAMGAYPPGTAVQLRNGQFAVVVRSNPQHRLRPLVLVLKDAKQRPLQPHYVDIAESRPQFHIARVVRGQDFDIDVHLFRERGFRESLVE